MGLFTASINTLTIKFVKSIKVTALSTSLTVLALSSLWVSQPVYAAQYSPNFKGTDINEFINIVGKILKKTIIIDPTVRGKVNVRSYDLLSEKQYYQFFLNVLEVYGYAVVDMGNGILKVVKAKDAKNSAIPVVGNDAPGVGDEMVTRVVEVKNVSVRELSPLLRQFSNQSGSGHVVHYDPSNVIMMTGSAATVNRLVDIINRVDRAGDLKVEIIKLQFASASEIVRILENIYKSTKKDQPEFLIPKIVSDDRTNSVIVSGEPQARSRVIKLIERLDAELESSGNTRVHYLKYAKAEEIVKVLTGVSDSLAADAKGGTSTKSSSRGQKRDYSIQAHADSNSLVINAEPDMMRSLEQIIRQLDIRRQQVLVEAIIVEVYESEGINLGVQWGSEDLGFTQFNNGAVTPVSTLAGAAYSARETTTEEIVYNTNDDGESVGSVLSTTTEGDYTTLASVLSSVSGFATGIFKDGWGVVLQAVSNDTNSNILATPSITTLDNEEASILVGSEVPIITGSSTGSNNTNPFQTVERTEVGIKLSITPQINEGNAVQLLISQEVSSVSGATGVDLGINKRSINTTVLAEDGATIVSGGLIDEDVQESVSKVPLLGDIPIIGHLFKSTSTTKRKRNLMVFIRAVIIRDDETLAGESNRKYNYIRAEQLKSEEDGIALMPFTSQPVLSEWDETIALPPSFEEYLNENQSDTLKKLEGKASEKETLKKDNESKGDN
jgi:general secretion pathway protein D